MPGDRGEISVHLAGATLPGKLAKWRRTAIPAGFTVIGDVVRGDGTGGLLVRGDGSGHLMCWDGLVLSGLPQHRTRASAARVIPEALEDERPVEPTPLRALASRLR